MARHEGGIFSRASGSTSGIVFSSVRDKRGKTMISREKVTPRDPKTTNQLSNRHKFGRIVSALSSWSPALWQDIFNKSVGQLPGWQSLESSLVPALGSDGKFQPAPDISTGNSFGWESGTIDYGVTDSSQIIVTVNGGSFDYPVDSILHAFAWVDFDGDWRTVDDTQFIYQTFEQSSESNEMSLTLNLDQELVDEVSDSLVHVLVQLPANSPRPTSRTRRRSSLRLEIQDMRSSGKV